MLSEPQVIDPEALALSLKIQANELYSKGRYFDAITLYTQAIELVPSSPTYYSNRSAAHLMSQDYPACLKDCKSALEKDDSLGKIWSRGLKCLMIQWKVQAAQDWVALGLKALKDQPHHPIFSKEVRNYN